MNIFPNNVDSGIETGVRLARIEDADSWAKIHLKALRQGLETALGQVSPQYLALFRETDITASWKEAIVNPPSPKHHLFTAVAGGEIVGFAAIAPVERPVEVLSVDSAQSSSASYTAVSSDSSTDSRDSSPAAGSVQPLRVDAEIVALEVADFHLQADDAGRLLNALSDVLRKSGASRVQVWLFSTDEEKIRFYSEAGFVPAGIRQKFQMGGKLLDQHLWYTEYKND